MGKLFHSLDDKMTLMQLTRIIERNDLAIIIRSAQIKFPFTAIYIIIQSWRVTDSSGSAFLSFAMTDPDFFI